MKEQPFQIRSKIWIEDENGRVVFGFGRYRILSAIDRLGSINSAAKELKMGYRAIWGKIKATEEALGKPLLIRNAGGSSGGGSQLTPLAQSLLEQFRLVHGQVNEEADKLFEHYFSFKMY